MVKSQDVLVVVQMAAERRAWSIAGLATRLQLPHATVQRAVSRCREVGFFDRDLSRIDPYMVEEFLVHAIRFEFPPKWVGSASGVPTAWTARPLAGLLAGSRSDAVVWPSHSGARKGRGLEPIHRAMPGYKLTNPLVYEWATVVDALRIGGARDRAVAQEALGRMIDSGLEAAA